MTNSHEALPNNIDPDPHFNRLIQLAGLSQAALQGVIQVLHAQDRHTTAPQDTETLLSHYITDPESPEQKHVA